MTTMDEEFQESATYEHEFLDWVTGCATAHMLFRASPRYAEVFHRWACDTAEDDAIERVRRNADEDLPL